MRIIRLGLIGPVAILAACFQPPLQPSPGPSEPYIPESTPLVVTPPDAAAALRESGLMVPVDGIAPNKVPDTFRARRGTDRMHGAVDIMAPRGTPVIAAAAGKVWKVRSNNLGGQTVYVIDHAERFVYYYAHLDRYAPGLKEGQQIEVGGVLGYVGTTGNAPKDVPHLHFQVLRYRGNGRWWDGDPIDPRPFLNRPGRMTR